MLKYLFIVLFLFSGMTHARQDPIPPTCEGTVDRMLLPWLTLTNQEEKPVFARRASVQGCWPLPDPIQEIAPDIVQAPVVAVPVVAAIEGAKPVIHSMPEPKSKDLEPSLVNPGTVEARDEWKTGSDWVMQTWDTISAGSGFSLKVVLIIALFTLSGSIMLSGQRSNS